MTSGNGDDDRPAQPNGGSTASKPAAKPVDPTPVAPGLYIVATPIGNLGDITLRALTVLRGADLIACEDTRVTAKLTRRYGIATRRLAYNDHNAERARPRILEKLRRGAAVALVSDAGTPLVSDPGYKLVSAAIAEGIPVTMAPGPTAPLTALALSGLPSDRFLFGGFLPAKATARQRVLIELALVPATLIFFEAPHRLGASLAEMTRTLGDRPAAVARELTKRHEEVRRGGLLALTRHYSESAPKGEIVVVVGPPGSAPRAAPEDEVAAIDAMLRENLASASLRDAAAAVAAATGQPRRRVYARALALMGKSGRE